MRDMSGSVQVAGLHILQCSRWHCAQVSPSLYWTESDFVCNVTIQSNTFTGTWGGILLGYVNDYTFEPGKQLSVGEG